ncbi:hypothetical protein SALBM135S_05135 [Streptomyces alboniger]
MLRGSVAVVLVGAALLAAFVLVEARTPRPLVPFSFFTERARAVANAATVPLSAGLAHLPFCGALLVAIAVVARPIAAFGTTNTALLGLLLTAAGLGRLARLPRPRRPVDGRGARHAGGGHRDGHRPGGAGARGARHGGGRGSERAAAEVAAGNGSTARRRHA